MRSWIVLLLFSCACEKPPPDPSTSWWCWPDTACFATKRSCDAASISTNVHQPCTARPIAYCTSGCTAATPGMRPFCSPTCWVDKPSCKAVPNHPESCAATPVPRHPELYPHYHTPGWWCWSMTGPNGSASECTKAKPHCEYDLADTLAKLQQPAGSATCHVPTAPPFCWSWAIDGELEFVCTVTREHCEGARAMAMQPVPAGHTRTAATPCAPWAYD